MYLGQPAEWAGRDSITDWSTSGHCIATAIVAALYQAISEIRNTSLETNFVHLRASLLGHWWQVLTWLCEIVMSVLTLSLPEDPKKVGDRQLERLSACLFSINCVTGSQHGWLDRFWPIRRNVSWCHFWALPFDPVLAEENLPPEFSNLNKYTVKLLSYPTCYVTRYN